MVCCMRSKRLWRRYKMNAENSNAGKGDNNKVETAEETPATPARPSPGSRIGLVLIFLVALAALLLSAYNLYLSGSLRDQADLTGILDRHAEQIREIGSRLDQNVTGTLERLASQLRDTAAGVAAAERKLSALESGLSRLTEQQRRNSASLQQLFEERKVDGDDWVLAEIEYLVLVAVHRLSLERDVSTALVALEAADNRLARMGEPALYEIRKQLAADMNALRAVPAVDITGKSLYLADLATRIETLPLQEIDPAGQDPGDRAVADEERPGWKRLLSAVWEEIKGLVIITRTGDPASVNLLPDERYFLYQNLRLQLETARQALIRRDTGNFHISIDMITGWLRDYFDSTDSRVADIVNTLEEMRRLDLDPELPDISASLDRLRDHLRNSAGTDISPAGTVDQ